MQPGMTFTIEPMLNEGGEDIRMLEDGWTYVTVSVACRQQYNEAAGAALQLTSRSRLLPCCAVLLYVLRDGSRSAQYEETILITPTGSEILTKHT